MIMTDAGPLVALLDRGESSHAACVACLGELTGPMLTTWPAFTEAMYLLGEAGGWVGQDALWSLVERGDVEIASQNAAQAQRMRILMAKYRDRPMDLADASLVVLAEERQVPRHLHAGSSRLFDVPPPPPPGVSAVAARDIGRSFVAPLRMFVSPRTVKTTRCGQARRIASCSTHDSNGVRFAETRLIDGRDPRKLAA